LLILDEAWLPLGHSVFRAKIREFLKTFRKENCGVVMATQSLSDAKNSGILDVLVESCPNKVFLPNITARQEVQSSLYQQMGLNNKQIEIIASATPKRDYYVVTPYGRRLIQLALQKNTLAFIGVSDKENVTSIKSLKKEFGPTWPKEWIRRQNPGGAQ
jgi:type IV secretion system protein VirB4